MVLTATLRIERDLKKWDDQDFPVLELALGLIRDFAVGQRLHFVSMCMEEDPVLVLRTLDGTSELITFDGVRFEVSNSELRQAVSLFVDQVDGILREMVGLSVGEIEKWLR